MKCNRPKRILWHSSKKDNGLGFKYRVVQDHAHWVRCQVRVKGKWVELDQMLKIEHVSEEHWKEFTEFAHMLGGFEEAIGREVLGAEALR
jgi:hypothetical protein